MNKEVVTTTSVSSTPIFGLLGLIFVTLKLCGVIYWPWVWVTAPFWGPAALLAAILLGILVFTGAVLLFVTLVAKFSK